MYEFNSEGKHMKVDPWGNGWKLVGLDAVNNQNQGIWKGPGGNLSIWNFDNNGQNTRRINIIYFI